MLPLRAAEAQRNLPEEIQQLIAGGVDPSTANGVGQTALHVACLWGTHKCVEVLIKAGAKVCDAPAPCGPGRVDTGESMSDERVCTTPQVNAQNSFSGATPLHCAAQDNERGDKEGRILAIKMLLAAGANPNLEVSIQKLCCWAVLCSTAPPH